MMSINLSDISILDIKDSDYGCIISLMSKKERINVDLTLKKWKIINYKLKLVLKYKNKKFHQHNGPISIKNINIIKIVVSNKASFGKKGFKYFIGYKDAKKLDPYPYFSQKWVHIEKTLRKLNIYLF